LPLGRALYTIPDWHQQRGKTGVEAQFSLIRDTVRVQLHENCGWTLFMPIGYP